MGMSKSRNEIPRATVTRLAFYLRELQQMHRSELSNVRSQSLAERLGLKDSQVRRDLSCLGTVGQRGVGYRIDDLIRSIQHVLGTDRAWNVVLVGVGNLGRALTGYKGFGEQGFRLVGVFDSDPKKIGLKVGGMVIRGLSSLVEFVQDQPADLAILAVPASAAQSVLLQIEEAGIPGVLNFAPVAVQPSAGSRTIVQEVDLAIELQRLAFSVVR
jgi:redox-sensing transcriptional repressor